MGQVSPIRARLNVSTDYAASHGLRRRHSAPILDATKFHYPPFGLKQINAAMTLPKQIAYSEPRLQPPPGYKDTTVPGVSSRDTLFSHGSHEPGWMVAPGMQGVDRSQVPHPRVRHCQLKREQAETCARR